VTFLAFSPLAAYALLFGVALAIVVLYWLKPRPLRTTVGSTLLWANVLKRRVRHAMRWRWVLSLLLALGIGLSLALALTRPELPALGLTGKRIVLVLDNSPSMAARTRDGRTRWLHALERARGLLRGTVGTVMLLDTMGTATSQGFVTRAQAMITLEGIEVGSSRAARLPVLPQERGLEVHLITDGVGLTGFPPGAVVHSVFETADNVAVTGLEARAFPADPTRYEAFVQLYNASPGSKRVRLTLRGGGHFAIEQELDMTAGELVDASFDVSRFEGGILGAAAATIGDALALDNTAFARVPTHRPRRVLLVTDGNMRLEGSLRVLPGIRLATVRPADYARAAAADAYVFDRFAPALPPPAGALLFRPAPAPWFPVGSAIIANPAIAGWDRSHPLTIGLNWHDLRVRQARPVDVPASETVVAAAQGALVAARRGSSPWILVGFAPQDSNLPLQPAFPVFLGNALDWLTQAAPPLIRPLGAIEVAVSGAQVTDGAGAPVPVVETADGVLFEAMQPSVYTVQGDGRRVEVIANVLDPRRADINRSMLRDERTAAEVAAPTPRVEPWVFFLLVGALLLMVEWAAYTRRVTA
jgi:hypothetical protein